MAKWLNKTYKRLFEGGLVKIKIPIDNIHDYLIMNLDFQHHYKSISL